MSRPPAGIRISLKERGGPTYRIELLKISFTRRFGIRRNGTKSVKLPEGTNGGRRGNPPLASQGGDQTDHSRVHSWST